MGLGWCNGPRGFGELSSMEPVTAALLPANAPPAQATAPSDFELLYRSRLGAVTSFFARRSDDPETVGDLTAETFLQALRSYSLFDARRGSADGWLFAIARRVFAGHCERTARTRDAHRRLAGHRVLDRDAIAELQDRIDAERSARELVARLQGMSTLEREALELVDLTGLEPRDAARALGVSPGTLRIRLFRARTHLRKDHRGDGQQRNAQF
jgi:RNA polymerase sigma factor (sigma-70 family)